MIRSRFFRSILIVALLTFTAFCVWTVTTDPQVILYATVLGLLAVTFAVGLLFTGRRRLALRVVGSPV